MTSIHPTIKAFLLFSQSHPSQNLGFIDAKATTLDLTINNQDLTITQSPAVLSSNRSGGTTGAVVWRVTPLFATWLSSPSNILFTTGILSATSTVLELGCGVSALVGLATGPLVKRYVLTDQSYVAKLVELNIAQNQRVRAPPPSASRRNKANKGGTAASSANVEFQSLDWETDTPHATTLCTPDVVVACDCIYNDALIPPLVQTSVEACRLKFGSAENDKVAGEEDLSGRMPCVCVVAQQLRDPEIFEAWLKEFMAKGFKVWRVPDTELPQGLRESSGFVVHVGVLKEAFER
ncbi:Ribosomal protein lysine methyltransferase [Gnomoniopsis smithogilvyi]|uniref:Ribosomal protein lysine methyltransferase n=1 Tax=Gnomoniopsis smithogilvyi TaxID=1191159 RepID=A0A9W8YRG2_9PEZI|nr:Ribosomal protein lysine methyltransferase [Gnomoniopsis smithogilvyi]